jgi:hypothetical protein
MRNDDTGPFAWNGSSDWRLLEAHRRRQCLEVRETGLERL